MMMFQFVSGHTKTMAPAVVPTHGSLSAEDRRGRGPRTLTVAIELRPADCGRFWPPFGTSATVLSASGRADAECAEVVTFLESPTILGRVLQSID